MTILYIVGGFIVGFWLCAILANRRIHEAHGLAALWHEAWEQLIRENVQRIAQDAARRKAGGDNA
jgi:hypothetical protein